MDSIKVSIEDAYFDKGYLWFFENRIQALCKMNVNNLEMEIVSIYKGKEKFTVRKIFFIHNKFYFIAGTSVNVLVYDEKKQEGQEFLLIKWGASDNLNRYMAYGYKDCIYFIPQLLDKKVICFDTCTQKYTKRFWLDCSLIERLEIHGYRIRYSYFNEGIVWCAVEGTSWYIKYRVPDEVVELFEVRGTLLSGICYDGKDVWLTQSNFGSLVCVGKANIEISEKPIDSWIHNVNGFLVVPPRYSDKLILVHKDTVEVITLELPFKDSEMKLKNGGSNIINCCETEEYIFLFQHGVRDLLVLCKDTFVVKRVQLKCEDYITKLLETTLCVEEQDIKLADLFLYLAQRVRYADEEKRREINTGKNIWKSIRNI